MTGRCNKVVLLVPTQGEIAGWVAPAGCETVICGVGCAAASAAVVSAVNLYRPDILILAGFAGAVRAEGAQVEMIDVGEVVAVKEERPADLGVVRDGKFSECFGVGYECPWLHLAAHLKAVDSRTVNASATPFARGGQIENMEGAGFMAAAAAFGVAYLEIRAISNFVGDWPADWKTKEASQALIEELSWLIPQLQNCEV